MREYEYFKLLALLTLGWETNTPVFAEILNYFTEKAKLVIF